MKMRRIAAFLIAACFMAMPVDPVGMTDTTMIAHAAEKSGTCGENLTWTLDDEGTLTISGTGEMDNWEAGKSPFNRYRIKNVVIEDGVTSIGDYAFYNAFEESVVIPDSVTSIGKGAFWYNQSLTTVTIPDSVKSIGDKAFYDCWYLKEVKICGPLTSVGADLFGSCSELTTVVIPDGTECIGDGMFAECSQLTEVVIPDSVTYIGDKAFLNCDKLENVVIPSGVKTIGDEAFMSTAMTSVVIPDGVTTIGKYTFSASSLTSIVIPDSVTTIGAGAFHACSMTSINIPDSVERIETYAFFSCKELTEVTIPESVTYIGYGAFCHCMSIETFTVMNPECEIFDDKCTFNNFYEFGGDDKNTATIRGYSGSTAEAYAKKYDRKFRALDDTSDIPDETKPTEEQSNACGENLTWTLDSKGTLTISGTGEMDDWGTVYLKEKLEDRPWHKYASSIKTVIVEEGVTTIGNNAFYECESLSSVTLPVGVTEIGQSAFGRCESLTSVALLDGLESIEDCAFYYCTNLTSVTMPSSLTLIGLGAFYECESLTEITIPENVKEIGCIAFGLCKSLESITILNPECKIFDNSDTILNTNNTCTATIYGYPGSTAEAYAQKYDRKFIALDGTPDIPDETKPSTTEPVTDPTETTPTPTESMPTPTGTLKVTLYGDVNCNDVTDIVDVIALNKNIMIGTPLTPQGQSNADVDDNGSIDAIDSLNILKSIVGLITLPVK